MTREILRRALLPLKRADAALREELHAVEYRLDSKIDSRFNEILDYMKKHTDSFQKLANSVIVKHTKFEQESASIHYNYQNLENRVKKVEEAVFPGQAG